MNDFFYLVENKKNFLKWVKKYKPLTYKNGKINISNEVRKLEDLDINILFYYLIGKNSDYLPNFKKHNNLKIKKEYSVVNKIKKENLEYLDFFDLDDLMVMELFSEYLIYNKNILQKFFLEINKER